MLAHAAIWIPVAIVVAVAMDIWAGLLHGGVWHRSLWPIHRSHHVPRTGRLERNDVLALLHAPPAIALILHGCAATESTGREIAYGVGIGMTVFAAGYATVHDGLVHGRLPVTALLRIGYLRRIVKAHRIHHTTAHGRPYSLFFGPIELRIANFTRRSRRAAQRRSSGPAARGRALS